MIAYCWTHTVGFDCTASVLKRIRHFFEVWNVSMDPHWEHSLLNAAQDWTTDNVCPYSSLLFGRWSSWKFKMVANQQSRRSAVFRLDAEKDMNLTWPGSLPHKTELGSWSPLTLLSGPTLWVYPAFTCCILLLQSARSRVYLMLLVDQLIRRDAVQIKPLRQELISLWRTGDPVWTTGEWN